MQKDHEIGKFEIEAFSLEWESKDMALLDCMNENVVFKLSINEKAKQCSNEDSIHENRHYRKMHGSVTCFNCGKKCQQMPWKMTHLIKRIWVPKGFHVLTNPQGPIKVWVPKSSN